MNKVTFNSCAIVDKKMYFISNFENLFAYMNIENGEISYIENVKGYELDTVGVGIEKVIQLSSKIYFFTIDGKKILIYNIENNSFKTININLDKKTWGNYAALIKLENTIFLFPSYGDCVVKIDTITDKILYEYDLYNDFNQNENEKVFTCGCQVKEEIWLFGNKHIIQYNLLTGEYKKQVLDLEKCNFVDVISIENHFYLLDERGRIFKWNVSKGDVKLLLDVAEGENSKVRMIPTQKNIWILPSLGKDIYIFDYECELFEVYENYPINFEYDTMSGWSKYHDYCRYEKKYYIAMKHSNYLLEIDEKVGEGKWIKPTFPSLTNKIKVFAEYKLVNKEESIGLRAFISSI